jgi:hypothetical protein
MLPQDVRNNKPLIVHSILYFGSVNQRSDTVEIISVLRVEIMLDVSGIFARTMGKCWAMVSGVT